MNKPTKPSDGLVAEEDFTYVKDAINNKLFPQLVSDLIDREPELAFGVSEHFDCALRMLNVMQMTPAQRVAIKRLLTLLAWSPLLATARAYRRAWEDFLPSVATDGAEGGGQ